jgi:hypothetical protein
MKCHICGLGPPQDPITLYRQNEKGVPGVWACAEHNTREIPPDEAELIAILEERDDDD